jgi:hypothetical protein
MPKKELSEKQLKKLIKKLKDAKKKKRKTKKDATVSQKVTQKIVIGSNIKDKNEGNAGRSFPVIQFLPQQNMDTQLLRDLLLRSNSSPLTREVTSKVPYRPTYDLSDQYGLNYNDNPFYSGSVGNSNNNEQSDNISDISEFTSDNPSDISEFTYDTPLVLQPPPQKQGTLDTPISTPKPNALAQSKITEFYKPEEPDLFSKETMPFVDDTPIKPKANNIYQKWLDENSSIYERTLVRPMDFIKPKNTLNEDKTVNLNKPTKKKKKKLPDDFSIDSADTIIIPEGNLKPSSKFYL